MSENTMNLALQRLGFSGDEMTPHGFRASASTFLNESGLWNSDAIYNRAKYWTERVAMMNWWAEHVVRQTNAR